jgi:DNA-binding IscR family transcriptional regulator
VGEDRVGVERPGHPAAVPAEHPRGAAHGGYQLARPATDITVADIIRAVDGPLANIAGARPEDLVYTGAASALRDTWVALRATMRSVLENVSLSDLATGKLPDDVTGLLSSDDAWQARR